MDSQVTPSSKDDESGSVAASISAGDKDKDTEFDRKSGVLKAKRQWRRTSTKLDDELSALLQSCKELLLETQQPLNQHPEHCTDSYNLLASRVIAALLVCGTDRVELRKFLKGLKSATISRYSPFAWHLVTFLE